MKTILFGISVTFICLAVSGGKQMDGCTWQCVIGSVGFGILAYLAAATCPYR